jgi:hypothetical protein
MPEQVGVDKVRSLVSAYARECLGDLAQAPEAPRPEAAVEAAGGWSVLVLAYPTLPGDGIPGLTECDRDCLALLAQAQERLSAARVRRVLEKRGIGIHAEITVKRSLARLKRRGLVGNRRRAPRGYYLPETPRLSAGPLVSGSGGAEIRVHQLEASVQIFL